MDFAGLVAGMARLRSLVLLEVGRTLTQVDHRLSVAAERTGLESAYRTRSSTASELQSPLIQGVVSSAQQQPPQELRPW